MPGKFLGVSRLPDLVGGLGAFHQLLGRPVSAGLGWLRSVKMSNLRAAVILLPLLLLSAFAWWTWRNVQETGNERAERIVSALADHTHRVLDVQETMLKSALARVRGQAADQIAGDASLPPFLADLSLGIAGDLMIVDPGTRRILASSSTWGAGRGRALGSRVAARRSRGPLCGGADKLGTQR